MTDQELQNNLNYYSDYFEAMFWADIDGNDDIQGDYGITDIDRDTLVKICKELDSFFEKADSILENTDYTQGQACHDFYFTRCGHEVGFWENDHCDEKAGQLLTDIAKSFSEVYISESNGKLYID
tara:strand:- start:339 stop:713 length:375 start_codon:yes stop_codon:yes gene_type:complete